MTYEVQMFKSFSEGHLTKEFNKKAAEGWVLISTAAMEKTYLIVTWGRPA
ncbi:MAG: hypothetical protein ABIP89_10405 [Polyangiaceae bacterium]